MANIIITHDLPMTVPLSALRPGDRFRYPGKKTLMRVYDVDQEDWRLVGDHPSRTGWDMPSSQVIPENVKDHTS